MAETQVCIKCNTKKPVDEFNWRSKKHGVRHYTCKACHSAYRRQHYLDNIEMYKAKARHWNEENQAGVRMRMRRYVLEYLLEHPCVDCGEKNPIVLEFDHIKGQKLSTISELKGSITRIERLKSEMDKCVVRCANCHRRKTATERGWYRAKMMVKLGLES